MICSSGSQISFLELLWFAGSAPLVRRSASSTKTSSGSPKLLLLLGVCRSCSSGSQDLLSGVLFNIHLPKTRASIFRTFMSILLSQKPVHLVCCAKTSEHPFLHLTQSMDHSSTLSSKFSIKSQPVRKVYSTNPNNDHGRNSAGKMSLRRWSVEVESQAPPVRLFKATFTDWHNLGPKLLPDIMTGATILSGHGSPGTIRRIDYSPAMAFSSLTQRLESIDHEKHELKLSQVEGGEIGRKLESSTAHIKVEGKGDGSVVWLEVTEKVVGGADVSEEAEKTKKVFIRSIKVVEEYLLANPESYA